MNIEGRITAKKIAFALGVDYYFSGEPCKRGHHVWRDVTGDCLECARLYNKEYHKRNRESIKNRKKQTDRAHYQDTLDYQKKRRRKYCKKNREKLNAARRNRYKNRKEKLRRKIYSTAYRLSIGKISESKSKILSYTAKDFEEYLLKNLCFRTLQEAYDAGYHLDHITPLKYILDKIQDQSMQLRISMDLRNLRLIPKEENIRKHDKTDLPLVQETIKYLWSKYNVNT